MDTPKGLRKGRRLAEIAPVALVLIGVAFAAFFAFRYLSEPTPVAAATSTSPGAAGGVAPTLFQPEVLWGVGVLALFLALAYGTWRYNSRDRDNDRVAEEATRDQYDRPHLPPGQQNRHREQIRRR